MGLKLQFVYCLPTKSFFTVGGWGTKPLNDLQKQNFGSEAGLPDSCSLNLGIFYFGGPWNAGRCYILGSTGMFHGHLVVCFIAI
jgi:hypothetical protein